MSTRCQIAFYCTAEASVRKPEAMIYRHQAGYPNGEHGVLAALLPFVRDFDARRGLSDASYAAARCLVALIKAHGTETDVLGYGIGGTNPHGDEEFFYRVDPSGVRVYSWRERKGFANWFNMRLIAHHPVNPEAR